MIAVSVSDLNQWGCPSCGFRSGTTPISQGGTALWQCGECDRYCYALNDGIEQTSFGQAEGPSAGFTLSVSGEPPQGVTLTHRSEHPRAGTPAHGAPDRRPETGGEHFGSRGLGLDVTPACFVCCFPEDLVRDNISAFVSCKAAGERVVQMFRWGARLDYREREPDRVQVKVGACKLHVPNLEQLHRLTYEAVGVITSDMISLARG